MYQECRHIKPNGSKCHSPAMKERPYCYYHLRVHKIALSQRAPAIPFEQQDLEIPFLEDRGAVQVAISEVVSALAARRIEFKRAALMIYALQVASSNAKTRPISSLRNQSATPPKTNRRRARPRNHHLRARRRRIRIRSRAHPRRTLDGRGKTAVGC